MRELVQVALDQDRAVVARAYLRGASHRPLFMYGDALSVLGELPSQSIDCCMTSPPYWGHRQYASSGIGREETFGDYVDKLSAICAELKRVLKDTGSLWLNIGDSYDEKRLLGIPWRVALALTDQQGWLLRNDV